MYLVDAFFSGHRRPPRRPRRPRGSRRPLAGPLLLGLAAFLFAASCAPARHSDPTPGLGHGTQAGQYDGRNAGPTARDRTERSSDRESRTADVQSRREAARQALLLPGTGEFVRRDQPEGPPVIESDEGILLNFARADLSEVVSTILNDLLGVNYVYEDRTLRGPVTLRSNRPLRRDQLLPTLESILEFHGLALLRSEGLYKIVGRDTAARGGAPVRVGASPRSAGAGYGIQVVPLRYISADEMEKILQPMAPDDGVLRVDKARNLLLLRGTQTQIESMLNAVRTFDVDLLEGMSFGVFPLLFVSAETLAEELDQVFGLVGDGALAGLVNFVPVEHLNAILVIAQQPQYLEQARIWIKRLDQSSDGSNRRVYVYYVQNTRAENLAQALSRIFEEDETEERRREREAGLVAPRATPVEITGEPSDGEPAAAPGVAPFRGAAERAVALPENTRIRIIAEPELNALIILATPQEYRMIDATLKQLDVVPLQVLIEASVYEVQLTDDLNYGIRWFLEAGNSTLSIDNLPAIAGTSAFSYVFSTANFIASLEALASMTELNLISSPELMVLDNHTAVLQVGDQVPVATRSSSSVSDPQAPVVNEIQFRNTGVILRVTPRVNVGGLVTLEIEQEVSSVTPSEEPTITPTIFQRTIQSTVAIQSGESVALGGLISDTATTSESGVPLLKDIPVLGNLFKTNSHDSRRTELLVLITPIVIRDPLEARKISDELRRQMRQVYPLIERHRATKANGGRRPGSAPEGAAGAPPE